jgi:hypothetical protein
MNVLGSVADAGGTGAKATAAVAASGVTTSALSLRKKERCEDDPVRIAISPFHAASPELSTQLRPGWLTKNCARLTHPAGYLPDASDAQIATPPVSPVYSTRFPSFCITM